MISFISTLLEFISVFLISRKLTHTEVIPKFQDFVFLSLDLVSVAYILVDEPLASYLWGQLLFWVYMILIYNLSFISGSILICITSIYIIVFEIASSAIMMLFPFTLTANETFIVGSVLTLLITLFSSLFLPIYELYEKILYSRIILRLIVVDSFVTLVCLMIFFKINDNQLIPFAFVLLFIVLLLLCYNISSYHYEDKYLAQIQEIDSYKKNMPIYEALISDIRASQHEYSNRIQTIQNLSKTCSTYEELVTSLESITLATSKSLPAYPLLAINNPIFTASLYSLYIRALSLNISIHFDVSCKELSSKLNYVTLSDLACILLQNAIEESDSTSTIYVNISSSKSSTRFEVRNSVPQEIPFNQIEKWFEKGFTTKNKPNSASTNHGLGLYYLKKQITLAKGTLFVDCQTIEDQKFVIISFEV